MPTTARCRDRWTINEKNPEREMSSESSSVRRAWLDDRVRSILRRAHLLRLAVDTGRDLHVTPNAFVESGHALWIVSARNSVKARAVNAQPSVGAHLQWRQFGLTINGTAEIIDPLRARGMYGLDRLLALPPAALRYLANNTGHIAGLVSDLGPNPALALGRLVIRIAPNRMVLIDQDRPVASWGNWTHTSLPRTEAGPAPSLASILDPTKLDPPLRQLVLEGGPATLAWSSPHGPLALPARWCGNPVVLCQLPADLMSQVGGQQCGPATLTLDTGHHSLNSKQGVMLRGTGRAGLNGQTASIALDPIKLTFWRGATTTSTDTCPRDNTTRPNIPKDSGGRCLYWSCSGRSPEQI